MSRHVAAPSPIQEEARLAFLRLVANLCRVADEDGVALDQQGPLTLLAAHATLPARAAESHLALVTPPALLAFETAAAISPRSAQITQDLPNWLASFLSTANHLGFDDQRAFSLLLRQAGGAARGLELHHSAWRGSQRTWRFVIAYSKQPTPQPQPLWDPGVFNRIHDAVLAFAERTENDATTTAPTGVPDA